MIPAHLIYQSLLTYRGPLRPSAQSLDLLHAGGQCPMPNAQFPFTEGMRGQSMIRGQIIQPPSAPQQSKEVTDASEMAYANRRYRLLSIQIMTVNG